MASKIKMRLEEEMRETFAERLRVAMAAAGVKGADVVRSLDVSPATVSKWVKGTAFPGTHHLMEFCKLTGCSVDWVMEPSRVDTVNTELPSRQMEGFVEDLRSITYRIEDAISRGALRD